MREAKTNFEYGELKMDAIKRALKSINGEIILFGVLLCIGVYIRAYHFGLIPIGVHQDEAMAAVDAKALLEYGTDRYGMRYPVHFTAWSNGQMSVFLSYCMIPFIKCFGFSTFSIRLPMLIISSISLVAVYCLGKKIAGIKLAVTFMAMTIINPWHFMQSRWSIDCNMFPHVFLIGFVFLIGGLKDKKKLYISMLFFGLCSYCYGIANYSVPLFLLVAAIYLFKSRSVKIKEIIVALCIYVLVVLPEFMTMFINMFGLKTIETPIFTIPYFAESVRSKDILFLDFSWGQLRNNLKNLFMVPWSRWEGTDFNSIWSIGPVYDITLFFCAFGMIVAIKKSIKGAEKETKEKYFLVILWMIMAMWVGVATDFVTVHRLNIVFYPILILASIGIVWCVEKWRYFAVPIAGTYLVMALMFAWKYFGEWADISRIYYYESFLNALEHAEEFSCDYYYIMPDPQDTGEKKVAEILTLYAHEVDALYFQGKTNVLDGVEVLPFEERYRFEYVTPEVLEKNEGNAVVYVVTGNDKTLFSEEKYDITSFYDEYYVVVDKKYIQ